MANVHMHWCAADGVTWQKAKYMSVYWSGSWHDAKAIWIWYGGQWNQCYSDVVGPLASIQIVPHTSTISQFETITLSLNGYDADGRPVGIVSGSISWFVDRDSDSIDFDGTFHPGTTGTAHVTANYGGFGDTCTITITT